MESNDYNDYNDFLNLQSKVKYIYFLSNIIKLSAAITSFWLIYLVFKTFGIFASIATFIGLSMVFGWIGAAPMFAIASSFISFYFHSIGLWLPFVSYVLSAISLYFDLKIDKLKKKYGL